MSILKTASISAAVLVLLGTALSAQEAAKPAPRQIEVSVAFSFPVAGKVEEGEAAALILEKGRRTADAIAAKECESLLQTIAAACRLERLNVNNNASRGDGVTISANASYRIEPKVP